MDVTYWIQELSWQRPGFWLLLSLVAGTTSAWTVAQSHPLRPWWALIRRVLLPYIALLLGAVSPRLIGLTGVDWRITLTQGVGLAFLLLLLTGIVRLALGEMLAAPADDAILRERPGLRWLHAFALEFHWCFLRGGLAEILVTGLGVDRPGPAVWLALGLALPELLGEERTALGRLMAVTVLVLTSVLFLYTRNFWLCALVHGLIRTLLAWRLAPARTGSS